LERGFVEGEEEKRRQSGRRLRGDEEDGEKNMMSREESVEIRRL